MGCGGESKYKRSNDGQPHKTKASRHASNQNLCRRLFLAEIFPGKKNPPGLKNAIKYKGNAIACRCSTHTKSSVLCCNNIQTIHIIRIIRKRINIKVWRKKSHKCIFQRKVLTSICLLSYTIICNFISAGMGVWALYESANLMALHRKAADWVYR